MDLVRSLREYAAGRHDQIKSFKAVAKNMSPVVFDTKQTRNVRKETS